ncbi:hypothetical protein ACS0PU_004949 [Formica fusca]
MLTHTEYRAQNGERERWRMEIQANNTHRREGITHTSENRKLQRSVRHQTLDLRYSGLGWRINRGSVRYQTPNGKHTWDLSKPKWKSYLWSVRPQWKTFLSLTER